MVPLWNLRRREGTAYHWDGLNTTLREVVQSSAHRRRRHDEVGGSRLREVEQHRSEADVEPAARDELHRRAAGAEVSVRRRRDAGGRAGAVTTRRTCAECHEQGGSAHRHGDSARRRSAPTVIASTCGRRRGDGLQRLRRRTHLEVLAFPEDERLHVGAARRHLADRAVSAQRIGADAGRSARAGRRSARRQFWRGYDVFDPSTRRLRHRRVEARSESARRSTCRSPGNSNAGHTYGTTLGAERRSARWSSI